MFTHTSIGLVYTSARLYSILNVYCKLTGRRSHSWGEAGAFLNFTKHDSCFFILLDGKFIYLQSGTVSLFPVSVPILTSEVAFSGDILTANLSHKPYPQEKAFPQCSCTIQWTHCFRTQTALFLSNYLPLAINTLHFIWEWSVSSLAEDFGVLSETWWTVGMNGT